jgi:hypothetical protein
MQAGIFITGILTAPVLCLGFAETSPTQKSRRQIVPAAFFLGGELNRRRDNPLRCGRHILEEKNHENL